MKAMQKSRNKALAAALIVLAVVFYAVSVVRMQQTEERRHAEDPNAHAPAQSLPRPSH
ncbi:hypothetical protein J2X48_000869 [Bosea sp. BE271]|uniref:hypothetical protein n=1 Tax=Bosea TaxID=85413 RepID=UPI002854A867|nr:MULTISPECIES: hypothetical protein [Bosea]MDR6826329.1 hypothetical protein [Bosea robiniae]MDR6893039.1 hypothetical protein [Bosea sp. BE109]MDR7137263.1 hypothetical protein [Bosea sp. BE168]MDR7173963.1 hypothetical protein [Bosea sp. BE271]